MAPAESIQNKLSPWEEFVLRHRNPVNLWIHFVSWLMFMGGPLTAIYTRNPWWLAPFFASGLVGAAGHAISGESDVSFKEATHSRKVPFFISKVFLMIALRRYPQEVQRVLSKSLVPEKGST